MVHVATPLGYSGLISKKLELRGFLMSSDTEEMSMNIQREATRGCNVAT